MRDFGGKFGLKAGANVAPIALHNRSIFGTEILPVRIKLHLAQFENTIVGMQIHGKKLLVELVFEGIAAFLDLFSQFRFGEFPEIEFRDVALREIREGGPHDFHIIYFLVDRVEIFFLVCHIGIGFYHTHPSIVSRDVQASDFV